MLGETYSISFRSGFLRMKRRGPLIVFRGDTSLDSSLGTCVGVLGACEGLIVKYDDPSWVMVDAVMQTGGDGVSVTMRRPLPSIDGDSWSANPLSKPTETQDSFEICLWFSGRMIKGTELRLSKTDVRGATVATSCSIKGDIAASGTVRCLPVLAIVAASGL